MKVSMSENYKKFFTVEEVQTAKQIIREMKEDESTPSEYAETAARCFNFGWIAKVLEAKATVEKNARAWNAYGDNSGNLDIWIDATVQTSSGFLILGAYLTDIWSITGDENDDIQFHAFIRKFAETT